MRNILIIITLAVLASCQVPISCPECNNDTTVIYLTDTVKIIETVTQTVIETDTFIVKKIDTVYHFVDTVPFELKQNCVTLDSIVGSLLYLSMQCDTGDGKYPCRVKALYKVIPDEPIIHHEFTVVNVIGHSTPCKGVYATPEIIINGLWKSEINLNSESDLNHLFDVPYGEIKTIEIKWTGDCYAGTGNDRNVFIKSVNIDGVNYLNTATFTGGVQWWSVYAYFYSNGSLMIQK